MKSLTTIALCQWLVLAAACGGSEPALELEITAPARGSIIAGGSTVVAGIVTGGATDGLTTVTINGTPVVVTDGAFSHTLNLDPGTSIIETVASAEGAEIADRRAISSGGLMVAAPLEGSLVLRMGSRGMASQAQAIRATVDMPSLYSQVMSTLLVDTGTGCTLDQITASNIATPVDQVFLYGLLDALGGEVLFSPLAMSLSADYMDSACTAQTGTFDFDTLELHWTYTLGLAIGDDEQAPVEVTLTDTATLYDHPLNYTNNDIDPLVFDRVQSAVDASYATRIIELTTPEIEIRTEQAFNALITETLPATSLSASASNGIVMTFTPQVTSSEPAFVATPEASILPRGADAVVAIADDAVDGALGAAWRAGAFDIALPSGTRLALLVPPVVRERDGQPVVVIGDWMAGEVSLSGEVILEANNDGVVLGLRAQTPSLVGDDSAIAGEASAALGPVLDQVLAVFALPVGPHADPEPTATIGAGHIELTTSL